MLIVKKTANGEASDWMAYEHDIIAISPELGIKGSKSETFYPNVEQGLEITSAYLVPSLYFINKTFRLLELKNLKVIRSPCASYISVLKGLMTVEKQIESATVSCPIASFITRAEIKLNNLGFSPFSSVTFNINMHEAKRFIILNEDNKIVLSFSESRNEPSLIQTNFVKEVMEATFTLIFVSSDVTDVVIKVEPGDFFKNTSQVTMGKLNLQGNEGEIEQPDTDEILRIWKLFDVFEKEVKVEDKGTWVVWFGIGILVVLVVLAVYITRHFKKKVEPIKRYTELENI